MRSSHCGVLEFVAEEGTCYLPYWLMQHLLLAEGDIVKVTNTSLSKGSYVKLQPVSKEFLDVHNPRAVLENCLRHFATLTKGDNIVINYNNKKFEIEIVDTKPADAISIIEADIEVDFAPPKDYVEPSPLPKPPTPAVSSATEPVVDEGPAYFTGAGVRLDGKPVKNPLPPMPRGEHPLLKKMAGNPPQPQTVTVIAPDGSIATKVQPAADPMTDEPWKRRVPGGIKREPPYGYLHLMEERKRRQR
jgi:ubiquitin fusion degradation protein 1